MQNTIHLYYRDTNWQKRWYSKNYNLIIDYDKKEYRTYENPFYWYWRENDIQVNKKSDILNLETLLNNNWFTRTTFLPY